MKASVESFDASLVELFGTYLVVSMETLDILGVVYEVQQVKTRALYI